MSHKISARDIALIGVMAAMLEGLKTVLNALPNIELVSLLIILYTLFFGWRVLFVLPIFTLLEGCMFGFGLWWIMYLYTWPLLALLTFLFRKQRSPLFWAVLCGAFGLFYGFFCAIPYLFINGVSGMFAWWIAGIPYDLIHCVANFVLCLLLFKPLSKALSQLCSRLHFSGALQI